MGVAGEAGLTLPRACVVLRNGAAAAGGQLGGYGGNVAMKRALLRAEGVQVSGTRIRDFGEKRWRGRQRRR